MQDVFEILSIFILVVSSVLGFASGTHEALNTGQCNHVMIAHYHPARILACELFKVRFK